MLLTAQQLWIIYLSIIAHLYPLDLRHIVVLKAHVDCIHHAIYLMILQSFLTVLDIYLHLVFHRHQFFYLLN